MPYNVLQTEQNAKGIIVLTKNQANIEISASQEDYLEAIYEIIMEKNGVKAVEISRRLGVGRSSVTEALKALADKKLVNYARYEVISLTKEGESLAKEISQKHHVLTDFFSEVLGLSPDDAQENACRVEHVISKDAAQRFEKLMDCYKQHNCKNNPCSINFKSQF